MKAVIIIPTYNERENITTLLTRLAAAARNIKNHTFTFLVVDDNSPDGTGKLVADYQKSHGSVVLVSGTKAGLGRALLRGMKYAVDHLGAEIIGQMDADLSHDPASLPDFFTKIDAGADFVVGSRYIHGGSIPDNWGLHRKLLSVIGNGIVRFGLGHLVIHDWTGGYRVYSKKYYQMVSDRLHAYSGYVFQIAFLHLSIMAGARVAEVPINFTDRRYGRSKIATSEYIRNVLAYVAGARIKAAIGGPFGKFLIVGSVGFIINTLILELLVWGGISPVIGSITGAEMAIISNFVLNNAWTFRTRKISGNKLGKFLQFNMTSLGALLIQSGSVLAGTTVWGDAVYRLFYIIGVGVGLFWNYWMYSRVIWKKPGK